VDFERQNALGTWNKQCGRESWSGQGESWALREPPSPRQAYAPFLASNYKYSSGYSESIEAYSRTGNS
jgi:hypothetical protein